MKIIACLDDNNGLLFNNRRQSRDRVVIEDILKDCHNSKLWINNFSKSLFDSPHVNISEEFLNEACESEYCFIENVNLKPYEKYIDEIILYKWNRVYPTDFYFDINLSTWNLTQVTEFKGNSHERITKEVYEK